jgi:hypothetical protein
MHRSLWAVLCLSASPLCLRRRCCPGHARSRLYACHSVENQYATGPSRISGSQAGSVFVFALF